MNDLQQIGVHELGSKSFFGGSQDQPSRLDREHLNLVQEHPEQQFEFMGTCDQAHLRME